MSTPPPSGRRRPTRAQPGRRAKLSARYLRAVGDEVGAEGLTPAALARAAVRVLPVDGAGLSSMVQVLRMPLGASGAPAAKAEELQTTLGEGPCLDAAQAQAALLLDHDDLAVRWPSYAEELDVQTPFRAVAAIPLYAPGRRVFAALDLYSIEPKLSDRLDLTEVDRHVAAPAAALLSTCVEEVRDVEDPQAAPEWYQSAAGRRHNAWVAIGMVMANQSRQTSDALSLLRAQARTRGRSLDDLTTDVVDGRLPLSDLTD